MTVQENDRCVEDLVQDIQIHIEDCIDYELQPESQAINAIREHAQAFEQIKINFMNNLKNKDQARNQYLRYLFHSANEAEKSYPSFMNR
ncbi:hypothetical protein [Desulfonatronum parangueonense]